VDRKVLVECGMCHTIALMPLALFETGFLKGYTGLDSGADSLRRK